MSLTEALRAGTPQAFGALYDEYAEPLYAYCYVMVGVEAGDALREAFVAVAGHPDAVPGEDAELPVWLHSLARAACVRRGALVRAVATTASADPLRRALALLSPEHREVLALTNALDPEQTARVLGVTREAAEASAWEAQRSLEQAAAVVSSGETRDSAMLSPLSGEALHRLVTLGHVPPAGHRERVLSSCATARRVSGGAAVSAADATPSPDARADDATRQIPSISPDEAATAPLRRVDASSADTRPDLFVAGEFRPAGPAPEESAGSADAVSAGVGSARWETIEAAWAEEDSNVRDGERPPLAGDTHVEQKRSSTGSRFLLPAVALVALVAAATGAAFALSGPDHAHDTGTVVRPSRSAQPAPSGDQTSPSPKAATSDTSASPTPTRTATATPRRGVASPTHSSSATPKRPAKPTRPAKATPTAKPTPTTKPTTPEPSPSAEPTPSAEPESPAEPSSPAEPAWTAEPTPTAEATRSAEPESSVEPSSPDEWPGRWTTRPRPHHTDTSGDAPGDGQGSIGRRDPGRACDGTSGRASRCARPRPWRPEW
ncbi:hypothetical protein [Actinoallomurus sp. CA-150999]|uniref:RNA polymerase sigma factor n=1 Tax=Actinoallomurus sp. CA-150999 TaxID=3239887 RepID=UPI003D8F6AE4